MSTVLRWRNPALGVISAEAGWDWGQIWWGWALSEMWQSCGQGTTPFLLRCSFSNSMGFLSVLSQMPVATNLCLCPEVFLPTLFFGLQGLVLWGTLPPRRILVHILLIGQVLGSLRIWIFDWEAGKFEFLFLLHSLYQGRHFLTWVMESL